MRNILVISFSFALCIAVVGGELKAANDYPPPPPVPAASASPLVKTTTTTPSPVKSTTKVTTVKSVITSKKPIPEVKTKKHKATPRVDAKPTVFKKPTVVKKPKVNKAQPAQRRDSSYGAPAAPSYAAPKRQVIIKQAGPSKQFGWIGHGRYAPLNIKSPFPKDLPKWIPMGNNIFEAGLLYPGKPGSSSKPTTSYSQPPQVPAQESYGAPQASNTYESPAPPPPSYESQDSYSAPAPASSGYAPASPAYAPPQPQPVYPKPTEAPPSYVQPSLPPEIPAQPAYQSNVPSYGQSTLLGQIYDPEPAPPAYSAPAAPVTAVPAYTTPRPTYPSTVASYTPAQPAYSNNQPFTAFGSVAHQSTFSSYPSTTAQPSYNQPAIEPAYQPIDKPGNFPTFDTLPGFAGQTYLEPSQTQYEAQGSINQPKAVAPSVNAFNAYDVPLKVEETYSPIEDDQDVYFIFYEDPNTPVGSSLGNYNPGPPTNNQFNPPKPDDIKTIYVPYEDAVNVPGVFDVSVGSSFGYSEPVNQPPPANPAPSSYDNPISSFDAPIYDENSYTAAASSYDANTFSDTLFYGGTPKKNEKNKRKVRRPAAIDESLENPSSVPFGSRLTTRSKYNILGL